MIAYNQTKRKIKGEAFGIFVTPSPSFLEYPRRLQHTKGQNNAQTRLDVEQIPCDKQIRTRLDPIAPRSRAPVFVEVFEGLEPRANTNVLKT